MAIGADDAVVVVGVEDGGDDATWDDAWIRKYDRFGNELWTVVHDGASSDFDAAHAVAIDSDDSILVAGVDFTYNVGLVWVRRYDPDGVELDVWTHEPPGSGGRPHGIAIDGDGSVVVTGETRYLGDDDLWTARLDANLELQWERLHDEANGDDEGNGVALDDDGNIYTMGVYRYLGDDFMLRTKYDTAGTLQWSHSAFGVAGIERRGQAIAWDPSGFFAVAGIEGYDRAMSASSTPGSAAGSASSPSRSKAPGRRPMGVATDSSSNLVVTGWDLLRRAAVRRLRAPLRHRSPRAPTWTYDSPAGDRDQGLAVAVDGDNHVVVVGYETRTDLAHGQDVLVAKIGSW